jgi:hypothetical protein
VQQPRVSTNKYEKFKQTYTKINQMCVMIDSHICIVNSMTSVLYGIHSFHKNLFQNDCLICQDNFKYIIYIINKLLIIFLKEIKLSIVRVNKCIYIILNFQ